MKADVEGLSEPVNSLDVADDMWLDLRRSHYEARRATGRGPCRCVGCGHPMHPKEIGATGTRFFAHDREAPESCVLKETENESPEHRHLKAAIFKAIKAVPGWTPDVEVPAPEPDPVTGRPVVVDVVGRQTGGVSGNVGTPILRGWEIQLSHEDVGQVLSRQQYRERWLNRCTWVTKTTPGWRDKLPWYQVSPIEGGSYLVVDGAVRWDDAAGDYMRLDPFPGNAMVRHILRGAFWAEDVGWQLDPTRVSNRRRSRLPGKRNVKSSVAEYCDRQAQLPSFAVTWTERDWVAYSRVARDKQQHGEALTLLDRLALDRHPAPLARDDEAAALQAGDAWSYDPLVDEKPCIECGKLVITSASSDYPIHHHCAWHLRRGDECTAAL